MGHSNSFCWYRCTRASVCSYSFCTHMCQSHIEHSIWSIMAQLTKRRELPGNSIVCCSLPNMERCKIASRNNRLCSGQWRRGDKWGMGCYAEHVPSRAWKSTLHHLISNFWPQCITIAQSNCIALKVTAEVFISLTFVVNFFFFKFSFYFNKKRMSTWRLCVKKLPLIFH